MLPLIKMTGDTHSQKWSKKKMKEGLPKLEEMWGNCEMLKMLHYTTKGEGTRNPMTAFSQNFSKFQCLSISKMSIIL